MLMLVCMRYHPLRGLSAIILVGCSKLDVIPQANVTCNSGQDTYIPTNTCCVLRYFVSVLNFQLIYIRKLCCQEQTIYPQNICCSTSVDNSSSEWNILYFFTLKPKYPLQISWIRCSFAINVVYNLHILDLFLPSAGFYECTFTLSVPAKYTGSSFFTVRSMLCVLSRSESLSRAAHHPLFPVMLFS